MAGDVVFCCPTGPAVQAAPTGCSSACYSFLSYSLRVQLVSFPEAEAHAMLENTISIEGRIIRTDWISKIQRGKKNGTLTCTIWLSVGPVGVYSFEGSAAKTALHLLSNHAALQA